jgi:16S rRNA G966 N2-methylase RsmD
VDLRDVSEKFGDEYLVNEHTYRMGIDQRFSTIMAERFRGRFVLETCTGAGLTTIALARAAEHVVTVEIEPAHQCQAKVNVSRARLRDRVTFVAGDVLESLALERLPRFDAAFLDPDWAVTGPDHIYRFRSSNTRPPADRLLRVVLDQSQDVALVLPPRVDVRELDELPDHERQYLFLGESHELICLYFGQLASCRGRTDLRI